MTFSELSLGHRCSQAQASKDNAAAQSWGRREGRWGPWDKGPPCANADPPGKKATCGFQTVVFPGLCTAELGQKLTLLHVTLLFGACGVSISVLGICVVCSVGLIHNAP